MSKYIAESMTMIAGRFGHEGLCQLRTELLPCTCLFRRIDDLLAFLLCIGLEIQYNYSCVILESVPHFCSLTTIGAQISMSDNFIHRVGVHYYAKGDKCDVSGKHI